MAEKSILSKADAWLFARLKEIVRQIYKQRYLLGGRIPHTKGYLEYHHDFIRSVLQDSNILQRFRGNEQLPPGYGYRLDERAVEIPWVIVRLNARPTLLLDAGSALNFEFILKLDLLSNKTIVIYTLAPEHTLPHPNVSYIYGDLRNTILRDHLFDEIVCISTLEHIGMDNTLVYTQDQRYKEARFWDYQDVLREFQRLLVPGGRLFLTVPYGKYQSCGWMQQFDRARLNDAIRIFDGKLEDQAFYRYTPEGWILSNADECAECEYFDFYARSGFDPDYATAARAVACVVLSR